MTVRDAMQASRPWLLLPRPMCSFCGLRSAKVGDLCCACHDDREARAQYAARCARAESES